tara:strand:- start:188 stop:1243 length:1056 start_codon:yes stop_codon:yes gene_type:complete
MIYVFEAKLADGRFVSSRFTGYPIPEIGLGFLAYYLGSWATNLSTYFFFIASIIIIFFSYSKKIELHKFGLFLLICLSNQTLFFDNLEPMDYSWALIFFSLGIFFFSKKYRELALLMFGFAVGARLNFLLFCFAFLVSYELPLVRNLRQKIIYCSIVFVIGGLFYLPIWYHFSFSLEWLTAARPLGQGIFGLLSRFTYKFWVAFGLIQLIIFIFLMIKTRKTPLITNLNFTLIIAVNLALFFYIPAELSYLQPALIFLYLLIVKYFSTKIISLFIILNLASWILNFDIVEINHKNNEICAPKEAISAKIYFNLKPGAVKNYFDTRDKISCWIKPDTIRGKRILEGKSINIK